MRYATTSPSEAGYYWLKEGDAEEIVEVWTDPSPGGAGTIFFIHRCGSGDAREVTALADVLWAGPIPHPSPPVTSVEGLRVVPPEVTQ